jgi:uncharacterized protein (TIGR02996 family)
LESPGGTGPFLRAILDKPDDQAPRLVFADWLDEHGDSDRAEVLRLWCAGANLPPGNARRTRLDRRQTSLCQAYSEHWADVCGLPLTPDEEAAIFASRLAETVAWCAGRRTKDFRTPAFQPTHIVWSKRSALRVTRTTADRQVMVNRLAVCRSRLLAGRGTSPGSPWSAGDGRLLAFFPDSTQSDGEAEEQSRGFLDADNIPAWDTWVWAGAGGGWDSYDSFLVAWVPPPLVQAVDLAVRFNPEECVQWVAGLDTPWARRLRWAGVHR